MLGDASARARRRFVATPQTRRHKLSACLRVPPITRICQSVITPSVKCRAQYEPADDLAAKRSKSTAPDVQGDEYDDGTVRDFNYTQPHAADSSPNEQEEREKRGEDLID